MKYEKAEESSLEGYNAGEAEEEEEGREQWNKYRDLIVFPPTQHCHMKASSLPLAMHIPPWHSRFP